MTDPAFDADAYARVKSELLEIGFSEDAAEATARGRGHGFTIPELRFVAKRGNGAAGTDDGAHDRRAVVGWTFPEPISVSEFQTARLAPACIVEHYLFADVAVVVAPGGTGKTTLLLYEAIHIVLARPLYGLGIRKPGCVLIVTAEDTREMLVARLRLMAEAMQLSATELDVVMRDIRISDVTGMGFKLTAIVGDVVVPAALADSIVEACSDDPPVLVSIDPAISFGVGEARVNDAEHGLIEAARRIRATLDCCVRFVHHTGKLNARDKTLDQYTGRGGSALPDGARMVAVLQPLSADEWLSATGIPLTNGEQGMVLARPKLSYCAPQPDILISRKGFTFTHTTRMDTNQGARLHAECEQLLTLLTHDLGRGIRHTQNSLEALGVMSRRAIRDAISTLISRGRLEHAKVEGAVAHGARTYLRPIVAAPADPGAPSDKAT